MRLGLLLMNTDHSKEEASVGGGGLGGDSKYIL
jgi:hypothetical protein